MPKWEYMTCFLQANADDQQQFFKQHWPNWSPPKFTPQAMIPALNELGDQGWELVHMEPVADVGVNADVYFNGDLRKWSNHYFCVFKRPAE